MKASEAIPVVVTFAGNDPTGGAGLQADIETLVSMGCHAAPVVTAITVQDTVDLKYYSPVESVEIIQQTRALLEDMAIGAFKIGMLPTVEIVETVYSLLSDYPETPVVLDPVLTTGAGTPLVDYDVIDALKTLLIPITRVLTPNSHEARTLANGADTLDACAQELLSLGCDMVLITGTHENTKHVNNRLYSNMRCLETYQWERLGNNYHGSGCTLSAGIAGLLAQGLEPLTAIHEAQEYTWQTLKHAFRAGMGQMIPNRLFWAFNNADED
jgi:hydroxymethylpyrimidine/phosphomethylpyrimidine kinase